MPTVVAPARNNLQRLILLRYVLVLAAAGGLAAAYIWALPLGSTAPVLWVIARY